MKTITTTSFYMLIVITLTACFKKDDYDNIKGENLLAFTSVSQTIRADGTGAATIEVKISHRATSTRRKITLKTSLGAFKGGSGDSIIINADDSFTASAQLTSVKKGEATVTAIIAGFSVKDTSKITFTQAFPDKISITVDSFSISNSYKSEMLLTAALSAGKGKPSTGHVVSFEVKTALGVPVGMFLNDNNEASTDAQGKATIRYTAGITSFTGKLTAIATTLDSFSATMKDTTYFFLTP